MGSRRDEHDEDAPVPNDPEEVAGEEGAEIPGSSEPEEVPAADATSVQEPEAADVGPAPAPVAPVIPEGGEVPVVGAVVELGAVRPGGVGNLSHLVVRSLGLGDGGKYEGAAVRRVQELQEDAGLEPDGVVDGPTWALVLRELRRGDSGQEVRILRNLLKLPPAGKFDDQVIHELGSDVCDRDTWIALFGSRDA